MKQNIDKNKMNIDDNLFSQQVPATYFDFQTSAWLGHIPFAFDLVKNIKPKLLVELGTHYGSSYFAFCQAIKQNGLETISYAIDTWTGDKHSGFYGNKVYEEVVLRNKEYEQFSALIKDTFDNASKQFSSNSIDLLHIDGLHTYEAVKHDFETWFPKVKSGGIILFHDITIRNKDFGVWKFWEEITSEFSENFAFLHSAGLGVLRKPCKDPQQIPYLNILFCDNHIILNLIKNFYINQWHLIENNYHASTNYKKLEDLHNQLVNKYQKLLNSTLWKLTKPLRFLLRILSLNKIENNMKS